MWGSELRGFAPQGALGARLCKQCPGPRSRAVLCSPVPSLPQRAPASGASAQKGSWWLFIR